MVVRSTSKRFKPGDLVPLKTPLGNVIWVELLDDEYPLNVFSKDSDTVKLYDAKALLYFIEAMEFRRQNKFDNIVITSGWERTGKSMLTIVEKRISDSSLYQDKERFADLIKTDNWSINDFMTDPLKLNQVCFDLDDYHKQISACQENGNDFIILDEAGYRLFALEWWSGDQINLIKEFQVIGKKRIKTDLNVPHKDDLNNRIRDRRVTFWQYVFTKQRGDKVDRGFVELREANPDKWKLQIYWNPTFVCRFPEINDHEWDEYELKKDQFINHIVEERTEMASMTGVGKRDVKYYRESNKLIMAMKDGRNGKDGWKQSDIAKVLGVTESLISQRIKKEMEMREIEANKIRIDYEMAKARQSKESEDSELIEAEKKLAELKELKGDENDTNEI